MRFDYKQRFDKYQRVTGASLKAMIDIGQDQYLVSFDLPDNKTTDAALIYPFSQGIYTDKYSIMAKSKTGDFIFIKGGYSPTPAMIQNEGKFAAFIVDLVKAYKMETLIEITNQ